MQTFHVSAFVRLITAVTFAVGISACGHDNPPTAPSASPTPASTPTPGTINGATISGTVLGVSTSSMVKPQGVSLTVSVTGTSISASVDGSGHFTLTNVPAGRIDLHFTGNGVDAHLDLGNVAEHVTLVITVRVAGNDAHLDDNRNPNPGAGDQIAEVEGTIAAGSLAGSCAAHNRSFSVGSTKVTTTASTQFRDGTCDSLKSGSHVEVKGTRQADNSIVAASVEGDNDEDDENDEAVVKGTIANGSLAGACATNTLSFRVGSTQVRTNGSTQFKDTSCASLKAGDSVEVKGTRQPDASVLASRVERNK